MKVEDLLPNLQDMTPEEIRAKIREIRTGRATITRKISKGAKKEKTPLQNARALLEKMTPAQKAALLEKLK